jgi:formylmethanofuran dehydrogenase subunit D
VSLGDATAFGEIVVIATCKRKHQRGIMRVGEKNFAEKVIIIIGIDITNPFDLSKVNFQI